jgi:arginyl-tRNA synthetase
VIPGDIGAELARVIRAAIAAGDLPGQAAGVPVTGTWRPAPARAGGGPGAYATSLPISLARLTGADPARLAAALAAGLTRRTWIAAARATGSGYLTVTVTPGHLTGLAARIVAAGPACLSSDALAGTRLTVPRLPDPPGDWRSYRDALVGRMARTAGAGVLFLDAQRNPHPGPTAADEPGLAPAAVARYGTDAVRYALARTASGAARAIDRQLALPMDLSNPYFRVIYAHADAASTLRWAADLALPVRSPTSQEAQPRELALLDAMSWLPERLAAAARRHRPAELAAHLEHLAGAWLDCRDSCPALPFGGRAAPADPGLMAARIERSDALRVVLSAGLAVLAVTAPARV